MSEDNAELEHLERYTNLKDALTASEIARSYVDTWEKRLTIAMTDALKLGASDVELEEASGWHRDTLRVFKHQVLHPGTALPWTAARTEDES